MKMLSRLNKCLLKARGTILSTVVLELILGGLWEAPRSTLFNPGYLWGKLIGINIAEEIDSVTQQVFIE